MKTRFTFIVIMLAISMYAIAQGTWVQKADFGGQGRQEAVGFSIGPVGFVGTGEVDSWDYRKDFWQYDPATDSWLFKSSFGGTGRGEAVGFSIGDKGYIGTGIDLDFTTCKDFWEYDLTNNTWTQKADLGGEEREMAVGFCIGNKGYIGTGADGSYNSLKDFWEYDPVTNMWTRKADFGGDSRKQATGFSIGNRGYLGMGEGRSDLWEYNPDTDVWIRKGDFIGTPGSTPVSFTIKNKGYYSPANFTKEFWQYDPVADSWTRKADCGSYIDLNAVGFSIGNKGYVGTGYKNGSDFWEYTPDEETDSCTSPSGLSIIRVADTAVFLGWSLPVDTVNGYRIRCQAVTTNDVHKRTVTANTKRVLIHGLLPGTTYKWQMKSFCAADTSAWINGPLFTTRISSAVTANIYNDLQTTDNTIKVMPNPNNGNFILQMQLPEKRTTTKIALYNDAGKKVWEQGLGSINGYVNYRITINNRIATGMYTLRVQRSDLQSIQKLVINK